MQQVSLQNNSMVTTQADKQRLRGTFLAGFRNHKWHAARRSKLRG